MRNIRVPGIELTTASLKESVAGRFPANADLELDPIFETPLELLIASLNQQARLTPLGKYLTFNNLSRLLTNRYRADFYMQAHPNLAKIEIRQPLFVIGLPRSGTTLLQNLMACDPDNRVLRLWEGLFPVPFASEDGTPREIRRFQADRSVRFLHNLSPELSKAHFLDADGVEACFRLFVHTFADFIFEVNFDVPAYSEWLVEHEDDARYYVDFRRFLQILSRQHTSRRWVLKSPRHLFALQALLETFPTARFLHIHRNPLTALASLCSLSRLSRLVYSAHVDALGIGRHFRARYSRCLQRAYAVRRRFNDRFHDVLYQDLVQSPVETIRNAYSFLGLEVSDAFSLNMERWLANNPKHKHGVHRYSVEEFGLTGPESHALQHDYSDCLPMIRFD